jgi:predicted DNA-binding transcriptional regulator AlpA
VLTGSAELAAPHGCLFASPSLGADPLRTSKQAAQPQVLESRILRPRDLLARYQISLPALFRWIREKKLPRPFKLVPGGRLVGWYESDLAEFEAQRRAA